MTVCTFAWCFALCALAVWRVAHLLARENGPFELVARLRATLGSGILGRLMDCFYCVCFLVSLLPALWMCNSRIGFFIQWLALSAVACLLERTTQKQQGNVRVAPVSPSHIDKIIGGV
jgi:hypothetical protein